MSIILFQSIIFSFICFIKCQLPIIDESSQSNLNDISQTNIELNLNIDVIQHT
jgi:hypothetical protein